MGRLEKFSLRHSASRIDDRCAVNLRSHPGPAVCRNQLRQGEVLRVVPADDQHPLACLFPFKRVPVEDRFRHAGRIPHPLHQRVCA